MASRDATKDSRSAIVETASEGAVAVDLNPKLAPAGAGTERGVPADPLADPIRGWHRLWPLTIRTRLILLVVAVFIPIVAAAMSDLWLQYKRERASIEQSVRETTRALALVVDRELGKREIVATMLAQSPYLESGDFRRFYDQAKQATASTGGWVVLVDRERQIVNTVLPFGAEIPPRPAGERPRFPFVTERAEVTPLAVGRITGVAAASIQAPVRRGSATPFNVGVTIRPEELQTILNEQGLPAAWVCAVLDGRGTVIARLPEPGRWIGKPAQADLRAAIAREPAGYLETVTLDGTRVLAVYNTSPVYGWTFVIGIPHNELGRSIERSMLDLIAIAVALFAISVLLALWFGRRIAGPIDTLREAALLLERNEPVRPVATGIRECDEVNAALVGASARIRRANQELETRVADAVSTTEQVQVQLAAAQRLEALGRLTGGVAHDFNNLLAVINNNLFLLQSKVGAATAPSELSAIQRAVNTGVRLTRQLLAFSRRQSLDLQRIELQEHLPAIAELIESSLGRGVALDVDIAPDVAPVEIDVAELELALINLAMNAKDAMVDGGQLTIRALNVEGDPPATGPRVEIAVSDTGSGIDPVVLSRAFEPFFTTKPAGYGTGLGLSQVQGFCLQAGGSARIASTPGKGTTVSLLLPPAHGPADAQITHRSAGDAEGLRVLLVDDNVDLMAATAPVLVSFGFDVATAANADEALQCLQRGEFDVVLSDVSMPGERNGLDLARIVRNDRPGLPVVLMTGYTSELQRAVSEGFRVLQKPCSPETLASVLQEAYAARG
ncbi:MAG: response regulator [Pseudomonadota bacterium]|nr:response regulator [Pseudomonadota bacterium]